MKEGREGKGREGEEGILGFWVWFWGWGWGVND